MNENEAPINDLESIVPVMRLSVLDWIALVVLIVGGLNWGLVGILNFDLIGAAFGQGTSIARAIYIVVGLAGLYGIFFAVKLAGQRR